MTTTSKPELAGAGGAAAGIGTAADRVGAASRLTADLVWRHIAKASFAVVSYVTPAGMPRSSGVVYTTVGRRLYFATAVDSWKARHIPARGRVAITVPVRRGGIMSLLLPIPPATISFHASAIVHPAGSLDGDPLATDLASLVPVERLAACRIVEVIPEDQFLTYGVGVALRHMRDPALARARVPAI